MDKELTSRVLVDATREAGAAVLEALGNHPVNIEGRISKVACEVVEERLREKEGFGVCCEKGASRETDNALIGDASLGKDGILTVEIVLMEDNQPLMAVVHRLHEKNEATVYAVRKGGAFVESPEEGIKKINAPQETRDIADLVRHLADVPKILEELFQEIRDQEKTSRARALANRLIVEEARVAGAVATARRRVAVKQRFPDFLIVGAAKCGTTSLFHYIRQHPQIFMPDSKELSFLAYGEKTLYFGYPAKCKRTYRLEDYLTWFGEAKDGQVAGEATPNYLYRYEETIENIKRYIPDWKNLRIIIILRNPVERTFSNYLMYRLTGLEPLEFGDALNKWKERFDDNWVTAFDYMGHSFYYRKVKAFLDNFSFVKVCLFDDFKEDAVGLVKGVFRFLEVDDEFVPDMSIKYSVSRASRFTFLNRFLLRPDLISSFLPLVKLIPLGKRVAATRRLIDWNMRSRMSSKHDDAKRHEMKDETRRYLQDLYREDILRVQDLTGRDLSSWLD